MSFPFWVNMIMATVLGVIAYANQHSSLFSAQSSMYDDTPLSPEALSKLGEVATFDGDDSVKRIDEVAPEEDDKDGEDK